MKRKKGYLVHSVQSNGCRRCIDYNDDSTFRANLNDAKDACECLPYESDDTTALGRGSSDAIVDTLFDITAPFNSACKCTTGKYTSTSSGSLMCLECAASAGFLDIAQLTDCLSASTQCEPNKGFSSVHEDETTDPQNPTVLCGCDTSKNFFDNVGTVTPLQGCYCHTGDNWWTLRAGEYKETTQYEADIDYTDTSFGFTIIGIRLF